MRKLISIVFSCVLLSACQPTIPKDALVLQAPPTELRALSSRDYETSDEKKIILASASVLQDLEFNISESEVKLGLVVGMKDRDATDAGQMAGLFLLAVLGNNPDLINSADAEQKIKASVVTKKKENKLVNVRVTFQRMVWNNRGQLNTVETIKDPELYQSFFEKLSKSIFLEGHKI